MVLSLFLCVRAFNTNTRKPNTGNLKTKSKLKRKKRIQQNENGKQNIETNLMQIFIFGFAKTIEKHCIVIVFMCQSIQHKHPKTKHAKLKNEIETQMKKTIQQNENRKQNIETNLL